MDARADESTDEVSKSTVEIPESLKKHLTYKVKSALEQGSSTNVDIDCCAANIVEKLVSDPIFATSKKSVSKTGETLAKALRVQTDRIAELLTTNGNSIDIPATLLAYEQYLRANNSIFTNIKNRHDNLNSVDWAEGTTHKDDLVSYSTAAEKMGDRPWVQHGNDWMRNFAVQFFTQGGARKHHMSGVRERYRAAHEGQEMSVEESKAMFDSFAKDLLVAPDGGDGDSDGDGYGGGKGSDGSKRSSAIRLLDVGSCYNPFTTDDTTAAAGGAAGADNSDNKLSPPSQFDITALDLYPAHNSVLQCDFLNLTVGPEGSEPVVEHPPAAATLADGANSVTAAAAAAANTPSGTGNNGSTSSDNDNSSGCDESSMSKLHQLPAASFDVVTMSLVLNYLPTAVHREVMVAKARQLLVRPGSNGQPHRRGLLLIVEKQSIFGKDCVSHPALWSGGKGGLCRNWKETICSYGFELVKYRTLEGAADGHRSHLFSFATADTPKSCSESVATSSTTANCALMQYTDGSAQLADVTLPALLLSSPSSAFGLRPRLWIKQDFDSTRVNSTVSTASGTVTKISATSGITSDDDDNKERVGSSSSQLVVGVKRERDVYENVIS